MGMEIEREHRAVGESYSIRTAGRDVATSAISRVEMMATGEETPTRKNAPDEYLTPEIW